MKTKKLLKFYFSAEKVEKALDRLILKRAAEIDFYRTAEYTAERVTEAIDKKRTLCSLYAFLDGVMSKFSDEEREALKSYAFGGKAAGDKLTHTLAVRFTRMAQRGVGRLGGGLEVVNEYDIFFQR
ncbi:MAG: hypothetical protein LUD27_05000 [Clostridia bacterium]|nr:hypothetical protein [Clostridia bacterium]